MDLVCKNPNKTLQDAPRTPQLGAKDGPRAAQEAPKTLQEPSKSCPKGAREAAQRCLGARRRPRAPLEPPKSSSDPLQTLILDHVGTDSHEMLYHFYLIFGGFGKVYSGWHGIRISRKLNSFSFNFDIIFRWLPCTCFDLSKAAYCYVWGRFHTALEACFANFPPAVLGNRRANRLRFSVCRTSRHPPNVKGSAEWAKPF